MALSLACSTVGENGRGSHDTRGDAGRVDITGIAAPRLRRAGLLCARPIAAARSPSPPLPAIPATSASASIGVETSFERGANRASLALSAFSFLGELMSAAGWSGEPTSLNSRSRGYRRRGRSAGRREAAKRLVGSFRRVARSVRRGRTMSRGAYRHEARKRKAHAAGKMYRRRRRDEH